MLVAWLLEDGRNRRGRLKDGENDVALRFGVAIHGNLIGGARAGLEIYLARQPAPAVVIIHDPHQAGEIRPRVHRKRGVEGTALRGNRGCVRHQRGPGPPNRLAGCGAEVRRFARFGGRSNVGPEDPVAGAGNWQAIGEVVVGRREQHRNTQSVGEGRFSRCCDHKGQGHLAIGCGHNQVGAVVPVAGHGIGGRAVVPHA